MEIKRWFKSLIDAWVMRICLRLARAHCKYQSGFLAFGESGMMLAMGMDLESVALGEDEEHQYLQVTLKQAYRTQEETPPALKNVFMYPGSSVALPKAKPIGGEGNV